VSRLDDGALRAIAGPKHDRHFGPMSSFAAEGFTTVADFTDQRRRARVVRHDLGTVALVAATTVDPAKTLEVTEQFGPTGGPMHVSRRCAKRSSDRCLTLKALTFSADRRQSSRAPTTSLPEQVGGQCATGTTASAGCATRH